MSSVIDVDVLVSNATKQINTNVSDDLIQQMIRHNKQLIELSGLSANLNSSTTLEQKMLIGLISLKEHNSSISYMKKIATRLNEIKETTITNSQIYTHPSNATLSVFVSPHLMRSWIVFHTYITSFVVSKGHWVHRNKISGLIVMKINITNIPWVSHIGNIDDVSVCHVIERRNLLIPRPICSFPVINTKGRISEHWMINTSGRVVPSRNFRHESSLYVHASITNEPSTPNTQSELTVVSVARFVSGCFYKTLLDPSLCDPSPRMAGHCVPIAQLIARGESGGDARLNLHLNHITNGKHRLNTLLLFELGGAHHRFWVPFRKRTNEHKVNYVKVWCTDKTLEAHPLRVIRQFSDLMRNEDIMIPQEPAKRRKLTTSF